MDRKEMVMDKKERKAAAKEWAKIVEEYPRFAKAHLAQQAILMEASEMGIRWVDARIWRLIEMGFIFPFLEFWLARCRPIPLPPLAGLLESLSHAKDPSECFNIQSEDDWFEDPLFEGQMRPDIKPWQSDRRREFGAIK